MKRLQYLLLIIAMCFSFGCSGNPWINAIKKSYSVVANAYLQKKYTCEKEYKKLNESGNPYLRYPCGLYTEESVSSLLQVAQEKDYFDYYVQFKIVILEHELILENKNSYFAYRVYKLTIERTIITNRGDAFADYSSGKLQVTHKGVIKYEGSYFHDGQYSTPEKIIEYFDLALEWFEQNQPKK